MGDSITLVKRGMHIFTFYILNKHYSGVKIKRHCQLKSIKRHSVKCKKKGILIFSQQF